MDDQGFIVTDRPRQHGDAWDGLLQEHVRLHGRRFFHIAYGILRDAHAAEDACQAALLKGWTLRDRIAEAGALHAWLLRVVITESLRLLRRRRSEARLQRHLVGSAPDGMSPAERVEFDEAFRAALADLPETTQTVVVLRLVEGLSGNEVKRVLGCSASEVSRRLHYGMEYLRERLSKTYLQQDGQPYHALR